MRSSEGVAVTLVLVAFLFVSVVLLTAVDLLLRFIDRDPCPSVSEHRGFLYELERACGG